MGAPSIDQLSVITGTPEGPSIVCGEFECRMNSHFFSFTNNPIVGPSDFSNSNAFESDSVCPPIAPSSKYQRLSFIPGISLILRTIGEMASANNTEPRGSPCCTPCCERMYELSARVRREACTRVNDTHGRIAGTCVATT